MSTAWTIRPERPGDAAAVSVVNTLAFRRRTEARLVERLRARARPYLGLVAAVGEEIVGHILFTPVSLRGDGTAPRSWRWRRWPCGPPGSGRGVGSALVRAGLAACRGAGHDVVVVVGHPAYYPRFGFVRARPLGLGSDPSFPDEAFMVAELTPGALGGRRGLVVYGEEFSEAV